MRIELKHRVTGSVLFSLETDSLKRAVEEAVKQKTDLSFVNLRGADLEGANLEEAYLGGADLERADLERADLYEANLRGANLYRVNLKGADLEEANLRGANLRGAYFEEAYFEGAYFEGANGEKLKLVGRRPLLIIGPIGSRSDYLNAILTDHGLYLKTGCFFGTREAFVKAVINNHEDNVHAQEYMTALKLAEIHAALWTPKAEEETA
jgi:uncharacterized protein YjbI with pentapeptide repeats